VLKELPDWTPPEEAKVSEYAYRGRTEYYVNCNAQVKNFFGS